MHTQTLNEYEMNLQRVLIIIDQKNTKRNKVIAKTGIEFAMIRYHSVLIRDSIFLLYFCRCII